MDTNISSGISNSTSKENPALNIFIYGYNSFDYKTIKTIGYSIILFLSMFGNSFILTTICKDFRLKSTPNFLVANMAISDLIAAVFFIPLRLAILHSDGKWAIDGFIGQILCKFCHFIPKTSASVSFYSCFFIAVDRYLVVAYPLRGGFSRSRLKYIITAIWVFSALLLSPYLYLLSLQKFKESIYCIVVDKSFFRVHFVIIISLTLAIPFPITSALYIIIVYKLRQHNRAPGNQSEIVQKRRQEQTRKVLSLSIAIISLSFVSWGFFSFVYVAGFGANINIDHVKSFAMFLAHASYSYNFFVYLIFNDIYLENFRLMISKFWCNTKIGLGFRTEIDITKTNDDSGKIANNGRSCIFLTQLQIHSSN